tara:strand:- start:12977 stop:13648 length:672 start_codon:yes stop_codon:yes gene_type:complete
MFILIARLIRTLLQLSHRESFYPGCETAEAVDACEGTKIGGLLARVLRKRGIEWACQGPGNFAESFWRRPLHEALEGVFLHVMKEWQWEGCPRGVMEAFMGIEGEVCFSLMHDLHIGGRRDVWVGIALRGAPTAEFEIDVHSYKCHLTGMRVLGNRTGAARTELWLVPADGQFEAVVTDHQPLINACKAAGITVWEYSRNGLLDESLLGRKDCDFSPERVATW